MAHWVPFAAPVTVIPALADMEPLLQETWLRTDWTYLKITTWWENHWEPLWSLWKYMNMCQNNSEYVSSYGHRYLMDFPLHFGRGRPCYKCFIYCIYRHFDHFVVTRSSCTRAFCNRTPKRQGCTFWSVHFVRFLRGQLILEDHRVCFFWGIL